MGHHIYSEAGQKGNSKGFFNVFPDSVEDTGKRGGRGTGVIIVHEALVEEEEN